MISEERLLSTAEVGERMGVDEQTVRLWIKQGKLEAFKVGRGWRIPRSALEAFLENVPKAQAPREQPVEPSAGAVEESEPDALAGTVRRLSAWGKEAAGSGARSADLQRDLELMDDVFEEAFHAYRTREARGEEAGSLAGAIEELVAASVEVEEALREAVERESDPSRKAQIVDFIKHRNRRGTARTLALRQAEAG